MLEQCFGVGVPVLILSMNSLETLRRRCSVFASSKRSERGKTRRRGSVSASYGNAEIRKKLAFVSCLVANSGAYSVKYV